MMGMFSKVDAGFGIDKVFTSIRVAVWPSLFRAEGDDILLQGPGKGNFPLVVHSDTVDQVCKSDCLGDSIGDVKKELDHNRGHFFK